MKRTITLFIIYISQIVFAVCYYVKDIWNSITSVLPFMGFGADILGIIVRYFKGWFNFPLFNNLPVMVQTIIVVLLLNIVFTIIFLLVFGLIALIQANQIRDELNNKAQKKFVLSEEERSKFDWKLYEEKFPIRRLISLIVPIFFLYLFLIIRFDIEFCKIEDLYNEGFFNTYSEIKPYFTTIIDGIENVFSRYILTMNRLTEVVGFTWLEWVIISVSFILVCLLWWGFFSLFSKPFGEMIAKNKAEKAKNDYIEKMELIEYNAWKKSLSETEISEKNLNLYANEEYIDDFDVDASVIAMTSDNKIDANEKLKENASEKQRDYIDDISTGVIDLGIVEEDETEIREPILVRETHFVGDEEIDIVLDEEPLVEVIEEVFYEDEIEEETFERYEPENIVSMTLEDKIRKYNVYVEETHEDEVIENQETIINDVEKEDIAKEVIEETIKEESSKIILKPEIKHVKKDSIRPIEINKDRKKVVDYIISTNNKNKKESIDNQEELQVLVQDETKIKPVHEIKKTNQKKIKPIEPMKVSKK